MRDRGACCRYLQPIKRVCRVAQSNEDSRKARRVRRLRRVSVVLGLVLVLAAVALFLGTSVTYDGHVESIDGQRNTNGLLLPLGLFGLGGVLLAFGLP